MKKTIIFIAFCIVSCLSTSGQTEMVSECLKIIELSESTFIHTCNSNNGIVYINNNEALIVSTPDSDLETQNLIDWVKNKHNAIIKAYVIDRWHPDAMEGLNIVEENNIPTYSSRKTQEIAKIKGLPVPHCGFREKLILKIGNDEVTCGYMGEAHTTDGIVVWVDEDKILFGGNEIRSLGGWIGNIADANLSEWSNTIRKVKKEYFMAKNVVPGHGPHGSLELIDYTIELYDFQKNVSNPYNFETQLMKVNDTRGILKIIASNKNSVMNTEHYSNGKISLIKEGKKIELHAIEFSYDNDKKLLSIPEGHIRIVNEGNMESFNFKKLYLQQRNDEVGLTIVIKEIARN